MGRIATQCWEQSEFVCGCVHAGQTKFDLLVGVMLVGRAELDQLAPRSKLYCNECGLPKPLKQGKNSNSLTSSCKEKQHPKVPALPVC